MRYKIKVPGSTSNLGCGFDTFGLALQLYNTFTIEESHNYSVDIVGEGENLPRDESNLFIRVYKRCFEVFGGRERPIRVFQENQIPTSRGLGSSSTAIVGGLMAYTVISEKKLDIKELLKVAFEFEPHPDNLLPAVLGGFVVCATDKESVHFAKLEFPADLMLVFAIPDFELSTEKARSVIKRQVSLEDAINNVQRASLFLASIFTGNYQLLKEAVKDKLHQPYRAELIPGFNKVVSNGYDAGALAVFLSGAGPTVGSLCLENPEDVGKAMIEAFESVGIRAKYLVLEVDHHGARVESLNS